MNLSFIIPTCNAGEQLKEIYNKLNFYLNNPNNELIIIDSSSNDDSLKFLGNEHANIQIITIPKSEFNHGGTRNKAARIAKGEVLVFLTQDAIPVDHTSLSKLVAPIINNQKVAMTYGRQLPHNNADFFGSFAREFNYPPISRIKNITDIKELGIKTVFASNSFAAYRKSSLLEINGFPENTILSEDTFVAAELIKKGFSVGYIAEAQVYHSHNYTIFHEFQRYFDIGVFYGREKWILKEFAQAEGEGAKFVVEQLKEIIKNRKFNLLPQFLMRNIMKFLGYKLGKLESVIPISVKSKISMHKGFWKLSN
jgi:rhamnosyltransferase